MNVTLAPTKGFDPTKDFDPIMLVATAQDVMMVPPILPFRSVRELIDYAKANPGKLNYASLGTGTSGHLALPLHRRLARQARGLPQGRDRQVGRGGEKRLADAAVT